MKDIRYAPWILLFLLAGLFGGCKTLDKAQGAYDQAMEYWEQAGFGSQAEEEAATDAEVQEPTEQPEEATQYRTLWKPISESRGGVLCIILGGKYRQEDFTKKAAINGDWTQLKDWRNGYANGNRVHTFFKSAGAAYGSPCTAKFGMVDGTTLVIKVADGGETV